MNKETKEYAIKALINESPNKVAKRLSLLLEDEYVDTLIRGVPIEVESIDVEALQKYCMRDKITESEVTHLDTQYVTIAYKYSIQIGNTEQSNLQSYTDTGWIEIDVKVAEETGVCKFKYV